MVDYERTRGTAQLLVTGERCSLNGFIIHIFQWNSVYEDTSHIYFGWLEINTHETYIILLQKRMYEYTNLPSLQFRNKNVHPWFFFCFTIEYLMNASFHVSGWKITHIWKLITIWYENVSLVNLRGHFQESIMTSFQVHILIMFDK